MKMWHPDALSQQLDKTIDKVVCCQRIVRGFIERRRFARLLASIRKQNDDDTLAFLNQVQRCGSIALEKQIYLRPKVKVSNNKLLF